MSGSNSAERKRHEPLVLVETADISEEDWLDYRRRGIGGSDVSAIFGTSPFRTARDLYYDKLNIASVEDDEGNWVAMEMGHLLEPLVAKIFERKTGYRVYQIKKMFQHPQYPWMLADVDYFVELPDGTTAILEIKTTNYNARDNWWMNGKETVPVYYESQGRHYMAVTDLDRCFFCCLYGNNEEEVIIREVKRDFEYEAEMVFLEQYFWENHVQRHVPPPYTESGALIIESARKHFGPADKNAPAVALDLDMTAKLMQYLRLLDEKKNAEVYSKEIDKDIQRLKALLIAEMGTSCTAVCEQEGVNYTVTYDSKIACTELTVIKRLTKEELFLHGLAYMVDHPRRVWSSHVAANRAMANCGYAVVRGKDPVATGRLGDILAFAKEAPDSESIVQVAVGQIDGVTLLPDVWYGVDLTRRTVN